MMEDFNLERFVKAQDAGYAGYQVALNEMRAGEKRSHWIWYIFPQFKRLGSSEMCKSYAIQSYDEAKAYLEHPVLGARLREITEVILSFPDDAKPDQFMMWSVDSRKLKSCMTLFDQVSPNDIFKKVLDKFFDGKKCNKTLMYLKEEL